ncbi:MAG: hypothetical protein ACJ763_04310 [Bdellovibrionia bacterium]
MGWLRGLRISVGIALLAALITFESAEARDDVVPGSRYMPAAAQAMGDAYLPVADDPASALFYNPAGLGLIRGVHADLMNLQLYGNSNYFSGVDLSHTDFVKVTSLNSYSAALQRSPNNWQGVGYSLVPAFYVKGIAFGLLIQEQVRARYNTSGSNPAIDYKSNYQIIPAMGGALRLAEGIVRIGYSLQWVNQASGEVDGSSPTGSLGYNQGLQKGSALSHTLGIALTMPYQHLPELNIVGRNLFMARFSGAAMMPFAQSSNGTPGNEGTSFDVSLSWIEKIGAGSEFTWVIEDRDAVNSSHISVLGRLAIGLEFNFRHVFFLRGGWGSGYPNVGLGLRRKKSELSLTWSNAEIGTGYHDVQDTRYILQYQVRAF